MAAIVEAELFEEFVLWHQQRQKNSQVDPFTQLRQICSEENYSIEIPDRQDRPNPLTDNPHDLPL